jgi:hypothetical protein
VLPPNVSYADSEIGIREVFGGDYRDAIIPCFDLFVTTDFTGLAFSVVRSMSPHTLMLPMRHGDDDAESTLSHVSLIQGVWRTS